MQYFQSTAHIDEALVREVAQLDDHDGLSTLVRLDLHLRDESKGKIRTIQNLHPLVNLRFLNLSYNAITRIEGLEALGALEELNLAENAITVIENLSSLRNLLRLNLSGNQIERISPAILALRKLAMLRVARNKLTVLDDVAILSRLPKLIHLRFDENPIARLEHGHAFAVHCCQSLEVLDGHDVTDEDRAEAAIFFQGIDIAFIVSQLVAGSNPDVGLPRAHLRSSTERFSTPQSPGRRDGDAAPGQELKDLSSRLDRLTSKLLSAEKEKAAVISELEDTREQVRRSQMEALVEDRDKAEQVQRELEQYKEELAHIREVAERYREMATGSKTQQDRDALLSAQYLRLSEEADLMRDRMAALDKAYQTALQSSRDKDQVILEYRRKLTGSSPREYDDGGSAFREKKSSLGKERDLKHDKKSRSNPVSTEISSANKAFEAIKNRLGAGRYDTYPVVGGKDRNNSSPSSREEDENGIYSDEYEEVGEQRTPYFDRNSSDDDGIEDGDYERYSFARRSQRRTSRGMSSARRGGSKRRAPPSPPTGLPDGAHSKAQAFSRDFHQSQEAVRRSHDAVSTNESAAAEVIAFALFDELVQRCPQGISKTALQDAAIRASFRLVHTALRRKSSGGVGVEVLPFEALGDSRMLETLVAETQRVMNVLEDSQLLIKEKEGLEALVSELRNNISQLENDMLAKEEGYQELSKHGEEATLKAKEAIVELDEISMRLVNSRTELQKLESSRFLVQKDLDSARAEVEELITLSGLERSTLDSIREKQRSVKYEVEQWQATLSKARMAATEEEKKGREIKGSAADRIRMMQLDLGKLEAAVTSKQRELEELESVRLTRLEEMELHRRDIENEQAIIAREVEELERRSSNLKAEARQAKLDAEKTGSRRRQSEQELARVAEACATEANRLENEMTDLKARHENTEKAANESEKRLHSLRQKIQALHTEHQNLKQSVEELKRQNSEQERSLQTRRQEAEDSLHVAQTQMQSALRTAKQTTTMAEEKRAELEAVVHEKRAVEHRLEDSKAALRDVEDQLGQARNQLRDTEVIREKLRTEMVSMREEDISLRQKVSVLRISIEADEKTADETRRRLTKLQAEEDELKSSEHRQRMDTVGLKKSLDDMTKDLAECRSNCEKERRAFSDLSARRQSIETDLVRCETERQFVIDMIAEEKKRLVEAEKSTSDMREEIRRLNQEASAAQRRLSEYGRQETDIKRRENETRTREEKLRLDAEIIATATSQERMQLDLARKEHTDALDQLSKTREELSKLEQAVINSNYDLDASRAQLQLVVNQRTGLMEDIERLRLTHREETLRTERLEESYINGDSRLKDLRAEITRAEERCEKMHHAADEQNIILEDLKRSSRTAASELKALETALSKSRLELDAERRAAIADLGLLSQAKQSIQSEIFSADEARRRSISIGRHQIATTPGSAETERLYGSSHKPVALNPELQAALKGNAVSLEVTPSTGNLRTEIDKLRDQRQDALKSVGYTIDPMGASLIGDSAVTPSSNFSGLANSARIPVDVNRMLNRAAINTAGGTSTTSSSSAKK